MIQEQTLIANRYRVIRLLGEGGMGKVYEVLDTVRDQACALKLLSRKLSSEEALLQFRQEFWFMTRLEHPNIIKVYEYGVLEDQTPYFTMEIVPGQELSELKQIPFEDLYRILSQASKALGFIHSRRLVHSDIKSENLRLTPEGQIKLMDFGLMQSIGTRSNGQITGTVAYMPPEIPQRGVFTEASDIYSLGVLAYELLAGLQPFVGTTVIDVIKAHIQSPPPPLQSFRPDLPPALGELVHKMLAKDPEARFNDTSELLMALSEVSGVEWVSEIEDKASYLSSHVLVARDQELGILKTALEQIKSEPTSKKDLLIGAPAGVGKSRLIEEFKIHSQLNELPFCQGVCVEQGMQPYEPLIRALEHTIPLASPESLELHGPRLAHLLPRLLERGIQVLDDFDPVQQKIALFETVVSWLREIAEKRPLVIFIDDLHWADMATLELFNYCIRGLEQSAVLMLGSFRDDEVLGNSPLWQTPEEDLSQFLKLNPFTPEQMAELIQKMLRDVTWPEDFVPYFYGATSGNAFFIREMLQYLMEENLIQRRKGAWLIPDNYTAWQLPNSIGDTIRLRLNRLGENAAELIQRLAVVGKRVVFPLLDHLAPDDSGDLFAILEELIERQFLVREPEAFYFPHDRVRETLYNSFETESRKDIHQQVAEWLEEQGEAVTALAYHFKNGRDRVKAMKYLFQASEASSVRMEATLLMNEGLEILEGLKNLPNQAPLLESQRRKLAWVSYMIHPFICAATNEKLIASLQAQETALEDQIEFESVLISSYTMIGRNGDALQRAQDLLKQLKPETISYGLVLFSRLNALLTRGELRQLVTEMEIAAEILKQRLARLPRQLIWAYAFCCFIREDAIAWLGEPIAQDDYANVPRQIGEKHDFLDLIFWSYYPAVVRNSLIGHYQQIKQVHDEIFNLIKKMGRPIQHENRYQICLAFAAIEHGELEEGQHYANKVVELGQRMQNKHQQASGKILLGMIAEQKNHLDDSILLFTEAVHLSRESETDQLLPAMYRLAGVYLKQKKRAQAQELLDEALELATGFRLENPYHQIHIYRLLGRLGMQQDLEPAQIQHYFDKSLELAEQTENPLQLGLTQLVYCKWLGEQGDLQGAQRLLTQARKSMESIQYTRSQRQIQEYQSWLNKQKQVKQPAVAEAKASHPMASLFQPEKAQELGYRLLEMMKDYDLPLPSSGGNQNMAQLSERLAKVERVNQFSQLIMKSLDLQIVLNNIMDYVVDIAKADRGLLMLKDDLGELAVQVVRSRDENIPESQLLSFSQSFTQKVLQTGQSLWVQDAQTDQEFAQQASIMALDLRTIICVPLKRDQDVIGLIYLDRQTITDSFQPQDLELVESMATFATISLINARLHAEIQESNAHLQMLNSLSRKISTTQDFSELLHMVLDFCLKITRAEMGYIFIAQDINTEPTRFEDLSCQVSQTADGTPLEEVQVSSTSIQRVLEDKKPLNIMNMADDEELSSQKSVMALDLSSIMCVPIYGKEEQLLGVVYVSSQAVNYTFTENDLELMESIIRQVGMDIENRSLMEIRKRQELMDQELTLARSIQSSMLPDYSPDIPSLEIVGYSNSAEEVGGDYYDYFKISDYELGLAIGDVNGHGISASLLMAMAKSCLFVQGKVDPSVLAMMNALNGMIFGGTKERLFMTFVYSIFDLQNHTVRLSSAGHHLPYHYQASSKALQPVQVRPSYPLGVRESVKFNEVTVQLAPHDILVYYTDGIIEAHTPDGEEYGFERMEQLIIAHAHQSAAEIKAVLLQSYEDWVQGQPAEDDLTLVVVKSRPVIEEEDPDKKLKTGFLTLINR